MGIGISNGVETKSVLNVQNGAQTQAAAKAATTLYNVKSDESEQQTSKLTAEGVNSELENLDETKETKNEKAQTTTEESDEELEKKRDELKAKSEKAQNDKEAAQKELKEQNELLENQQKAYDKKLAEIKAANEKIEEITQKIEDATEKLEQDVKRETLRVTLKAMMNYNKDEDGDWDKYLEKQLEGVVPDSSMGIYLKALGNTSQDLINEVQIACGELTALGNAIEATQGKIKSLTADIEAYDKIISDNAPQIKELDEKIAASKAAKAAAAAAAAAAANSTEATTNTTEGTTAPTATAATTATAQPGYMNAAGVPDGKPSTKKVEDLVSAQELELAKSSGVNLSEKLTDGSPRYLIAKGKQDNAYHIYDLSSNSPYPGASIARLYGTGTAENNIGGVKGLAICPMGNGYMMGLSYGSSTQTTSDSSSSPVMISTGGSTSPIVNIGNTASSAASACPITGSCDSVYYMDESGILEETSASYMTCSPLSFDLDGDGVSTSDRIIDFDIDGDGEMDKIYDSADAVLVFDKDGDGISGEDGSECFGDNTDLDGDGVKDGYKNGFEALLALAKKENLVNDADDMTLDADDLGVLEEKYGLKIKKGGYNDEAKSLKEVGMTEINLSSAAAEMTKNFDGKGNDIMTQKGATFKVNGETREYADIWHKKLDKTEVSSPNEETKKSTSAKYAELLDNMVSSSNKENENNFFMSVKQIRTSNEEAMKKAQQAIARYLR